MPYFEEKGQGGLCQPPDRVAGFAKCLVWAVLAIGSAWVCRLSAVGWQAVGLGYADKATACLLKAGRRLFCGEGLFLFFCDFTL